MLTRGVFQQRMKRLILASKSPAKREVLERAGFRFDVVGTEVDETYRGEDPVRYVERLAREKAVAAAKRFCPPEGVVVLGADTVVVAESTLLGKPRSPTEACQMLEKLSGGRHQVISGVALVEPGSSRCISGHEITQVYFRPLLPEEIQEYVTSGEAEGRAGAYAIQGRAARFVARVEGCYFNVIGLPVALVDRLLREWEGRG